MSGPRITTGFILNQNHEDVRRRLDYPCDAGCGRTLGHEASTTRSLRFTVIDDHAYCSVCGEEGMRGALRRCKDIAS